LTPEAFLILTIASKHFTDIATLSDIQLDLMNLIVTMMEAWLVMSRSRRKEVHAKWK